MKSILLSIFLITTLTLTGCGKFSPLSPGINDKIQNQNGTIEELKNNQNGLILELGKIRQDSELNARDIKDLQQGVVNIKGGENSGIQIFSGDGGFVMLIALALLAFAFVTHYRERAIKSEKTAEILAQQVAIHDDPELDDKIFLSALNTDVEQDVYRLIVKQQSLAGKSKS